MSAPSASLTLPRLPSESPATPGKAGLLVMGIVLTLLTIVTTMVGGGDLPLVLAPALGFLVLWVMARLPIRHTLFVLIFLGLTLECGYENPASGLWKSPLYMIGNLLLSKWNDVLFIKPLIFTGVDLVAGYLLVVMAWRRATKSRIDLEGQVQTAGVLALAAFLTLSATFWVWGYGLARGGSFSGSLLQVYKVVYIPFLFFLCQAAFRGPADHPSIAKAIIGAAVVKSLLAFYIHRTVFEPSGEAIPYATTHGDSMLFAGGFAMIVAILNERVNYKRRGFTLLMTMLLGIVLIGMISNTRRLVWVEVASILITFYLMSPWTMLKRRVTRVVLMSLPVLSIYIAIGWNSPSGPFKPVKLVRSVVDSKSDGSTMWRDLENVNLIQNILDHPIAGAGFGHEYVENIKLPSVADAYKEFRLMPHNSVLGFLAFAGFLGFSLLWSVLTIAILLAARSYRVAKEPLDRAMALWVIATLIAYINSVYGDIGQLSWTAVFTVCPALAVAGKLAIATGAWPARRRKIKAGLQTV